MKKIKKLLTIFLSVVMLLSLCFCLTGCGCEPYDLKTWYLKNYVDENGDCHYTGYDSIAEDNSIKFMSRLFDKLNLENSLPKTSSKSSITPSTRETVVTLAHQGWTPETIADKLKLSVGEVELILGTYQN